MIKQLANLFFALCLTIPGALMAHTAEWFDANPSAHDGQTRMSGPYHFELVIDGKNLSIYVTDHANNPIDVEISKGSVTFLNDDNEKSIKILPTGENLLTGSGEFSATDSSRIWLSVKFPDEPAWRAKFSAKAKKGTIEKPAKAVDHSTMDHSKMNHGKMEQCEMKDCPMNAKGEKGKMGQGKMEQCEMKDCPMNAKGEKGKMGQGKMEQCEMKDCPMNAKGEKGKMGQCKTEQCEMKDCPMNAKGEKGKMNHCKMQRSQMQSKQIETGMDHSKMSH